LQINKDDYSWVISKGTKEEGSGFTFKIKCAVKCLLMDTYAHARSARVSKTSFRQCTGWVWFLESTYYTWSVLSQEYGQGPRRSRPGSVLVAGWKEDPATCCSSLPPSCSLYLTLHKAFSRVLVSGCSSHVMSLSSYALCHARTIRLGVYTHLPAFAGSVPSAWGLFSLLTSSSSASPALS
jgi:hypothetical protein